MLTGSPAPSQGEPSIRPRMPGGTRVEGKIHLCPTGGTGPQEELRWPCGHSARGRFPADRCEQRRTHPQPYGGRGASCFVDHAIPWPNEFDGDQDRISPRHGRCSWRVLLRWGRPPGGRTLAVAGSWWFALRDFAAETKREVLAEKSTCRLKRILAAWVAG